MKVLKQVATIILLLSVMLMIPASTTVAAEPTYGFRVFNNIGYLGDGGTVEFYCRGVPNGVLPDGTNTIYTVHAYNQHLHYQGYNGRWHEVRVWPGCTVAFYVNNEGHIRADVR